MNIELQRLSSVEIKGFKPFKDFKTRLNQLEVIVGANATGKSSLFEFLKFLRDSVQGEIPPEIVKGSIGQIFHQPGNDTIEWDIGIESKEKECFHYDGALLGPKGFPKIVLESIYKENSPPLFYLSDEGDTIFISEEAMGIGEIQTGTVIPRRKTNQLALNSIAPIRTVPFAILEYITNWRFYSTLFIADRALRKPVFTSQEPTLIENCSNLSSVLHYYATEHQTIFETLQFTLKNTIPGFKRLNVKARGGPGEVLALWEEEGAAGELSLADLSDGTITFLCWATLCLHPSPPPLICIDEPELGLHPRALPALAGLFKRASEKTQVLLTTHSSFFLSQFDLVQIGIMKRINGESILLRPSHSESLKNLLDEFGNAELVSMHLSDELEALA